MGEPIGLVRRRIVYRGISLFGCIPVVRLYHVVDGSVLVVRRGVGPVIFAMNIPWCKAGNANWHVLCASLRENPTHALPFRQIDCLAGCYLDRVSVRVLNHNLHVQVIPVRPVPIVCAQSVRD